MSRFGRRYWAALTGANDRVYAGAIGSGRAGYSFGQRYLAGLLDVPLPSRAEATTRLPRAVRRHRLINRTRVLLLLAVLAALAAWIGGVIGIFAVGAVFGYAYLFGGRRALRVMRAQPATLEHHAELHRILDELAARARMPTPRLYLSPASAPNAFAVGSGQRAAVCLMARTVHVLDEEQLRAVIGYELALIDNRSAMAGAMAGWLADLLPFFGAPVWLVPVGPGDRVPFLSRVMTMLIGPIAALLAYVTVGRSQQLWADQRAVELTGNREALASALRCLATEAQALPLAPEPKLVPWSHLLIVDPFRPRSARLASFAHRAIDERVGALAGRYPRLGATPG
jgi:heat shock protein HtpX